MARSRAQLQNDLTEMFKDGYDYQESKEATDSIETANSTQNIFVAGILYKGLTRDTPISHYETRGT